MSRVPCILAIVALALGGPAAPAAEPVVAVAGPLQVVVDYHGAPVAFGLAHCRVDLDDAAIAACRERLEALVLGQQASVIYKPEFGVDASGTGRVHLKIGSKHVNQILVAEGLARYDDGGDQSTYARLLAMAQERAEADKLGLWGRAPVVAAAQPAAPAAPAAAPAPTGPQGPWCAEISGNRYFASDDPRVDQLNQAKLIYYRDEDAARRAGKRPAPPAAAETGGGEADADRLLSEAKELYGEAIAAGNTTRRDDLYGEAFGKFTAALQIYSPLVEADPDNSALAEKLRETMQLRYGAMKQRRF